MTAGMRARRVVPLNFEAPLQPVKLTEVLIFITKQQTLSLPSWPQVSQNSILTYDGVVVLMQLSAGALMSSHEHDLETTTLSLTAMIKIRDIKKVD